MTWPREQPTEPDYYWRCPTDWRVQPLYISIPMFKWPKVDPLNHSFVHAEGDLKQIDISAEDFPKIHTSHDLDMKMSLEHYPEYRWLLLSPSGSSSLSEKDFLRKFPLVLETESGHFPHFARPAVGDHVTVEGRWIFDCGHEPKTEIHPIPLFESDHIGYRPLYEGGRLHDVRLVRVWMNSSPGAFSYRFSHPFSFSVDMPYGSGEIPFIRVLQGSPDAVSAKLVGKKVYISTTPPAPTGQFYYELMVGYLSKSESYFENDIYTVTLDKIKIVKEHDSDWFLDVHINGEWRKIFHDSDVDEDDPPIPLDEAIAPVTVAGTELYLGVAGYSKTLWDLGKGELDHGSWNLGTLGSKVGEQRKVCRNGASGCAEGTTGDWVLYYTVRKGGFVPPILTDYSWWAPRLADEPEINMGTLSVPPAGAPAAVTNRDAYLTEYPLKHGDIRIFGRDVDVYSFHLNDFGHVEFGSVPRGVHLTHKGWSGLGYLPEHLREMFGDIHYKVIVQSTSGSAGDQPYTLSIRRTWRDLPPDWGVGHDRIELIEDAKREGHYIRIGGRLVDLYTPADAAGEALPPEGPTFMAGGDSRVLAMDWAWQHVPGEIHYYDVWFPDSVDRPEGQPECEYDQEAILEIAAEGMHLSVLESKEEANNNLSLRDLKTRYPDGHVHVKVTNPTGRRGIYQFGAQWYNATYYTPKGCKERRKFFKEISTLTRPVPWPVITRPGPSDPPWWKDGIVFPRGGFILLRDIPQQIFDVIISTPGEMPVTAYLYDSENVLVAESTPIDQETLQRTPIAPGVSSHRRLIAKGLKEGDTYAVHLVPEFDISNGQMQSCRVGISQVR